MTVNDESLRTVLDILTFAWLLAWAAKGSRNLITSERDSVSFLFITHFVFCGVPLLLDHAVGKPDFHLWRGFDIAASDGATALVYCFYVSACPPIWWYFGRSRSRSKAIPRFSNAAASLKRLSWKGRSLLHILLISPLIAWYLAPNPSAYYEYGAIMSGNFTIEELAYHPVFTALTLIGVVAAAALLYSQRRLKLTCCYILPIALLAAWVNGKRYIVLIIVVLFGCALWSRGAIKRRTFVILAPVAAAMFLFFSAAYQGELRGFNMSDSGKQYDNIRLDYGRESVIRMTLYAELHPDTGAILEYRMQSLLFDLTMFVPRTIWPDKPWPYAVYATASAFRVPIRELGWGITTNWLEEAVANFGWPGLIIGPMLLACICRIGDATQDSIVRLVTILFSSMFLAVQLPAFAPLAGIWLVAVVASRRGRSQAFRLVSVSNLRSRAVPVGGWRLPSTVPPQQTRHLASERTPAISSPRALWKDAL